MYLLFSPLCSLLYEDTNKPKKHDQPQNYINRPNTVSIVSLMDLRGK